MSLLETLRNSLLARFANDEPVFYASDLGPPGEQDFVAILGLDRLTFTSPQLSDIQNGQLCVRGPTSAIGLQSFPFDLVLEEQTNDHYGTFLVFTLQPRVPLPDTWEFSQSFPDVHGSFFDNLRLFDAYLITTSFAHSVATPAMTLAKGINFWAKSAPSGALASLSSLFPSLTQIVLQGMVTREGEKFAVQLTASIDDAPITISSPFTLHLEHIPASDLVAAKNTSDLEGSILASATQFPYSIGIPTTCDPLDELQRTLTERLVYGNLTFFDTDLGPEVAASFFASVGVHALEVTDASLVRQGDQLIVRGNVSVFALSNATPILLTIDEHGQRLDFTLMPTSIPQDWKPSSSFHQLANTFFDELRLSDVQLVATSNAHTLASPPLSLLEGLNFLAMTSTTGSLQRLSELGPAFANTFSLQGTVIARDASYEIRLAYSIPMKLELSLLGFETATIWQPVLWLESIPEAENVTNCAVIRGTTELPPFENHPGKLFVPVDDVDVYWQLEKDTSFLALPSVASLLAFYGQDRVARLFPESFKGLDNIVVSELDSSFLQGHAKMCSVFTELSLASAVDGTPRTWQICPQLTVGDLGCGLTVSYYPYDTNGTQMGFRCLLSGKVTIGTTADLFIDLAIPLDGDWELTVSPENVRVPTLSDIAAFIWPSGGHGQDDVLQPLPSGLIQSDLVINISEVQMGFNPYTPSLSFFSFLLEQSGVWSIIPNALAVSGWSVEMRIDTKESIAITGLLHGFMTIGSSAHAIANIEATLPVPADEEGWTLRLKEGTTIEVPSFGELLVLIGGERYAEGIPENLARIGGLTVSILEINFVPAPPALHWFSFAMHSRQDWVLVEDILLIKDVETNFDIRKRADGKYDTTGVISGTVFVFNTQLWIMAGREDVRQSWTLTLATQKSVHIPGLAELAAWMLPASMLSYIPVSFMPFGQGFDLTEVNIGFDISTMNLQRIYFCIHNSEAWEVIPGYSFILVDNVEVKADIGHPFRAQQTLVCHIEGTIRLGAFGLLLQADKATPEATWVLEGHLAEPVTLDFEALFQDILPATLPMPYDYGFPRSVTITSAAAELTPTTGVLHFAAESDFDWVFDFALVQFRVNRLSTEVALETANDTEKRYYAFTARGNFAFCGLTMDLAFHTSNKDSIDTVLTAVIAPEQAQNISLPSVADTLTTTATTGDAWEALVPRDFTSLSFATGYVHLNLTRNQFFLYGDVRGFGTIAFLTKKLVDTTWGYLFALDLGPDFAFGNICRNLTIIDTIVKVKQAGIFLSSFVESSDEMMADIRLVQDFPDAPQGFVVPLPLENLPRTQLQKGAYFYGNLEFPAASLFGTILQIGACATGLANVIFSGFIAFDDSINTVFEADLPDITILETIIFTHTVDYPGIHLQYTAKDGKFDEFQLIGRIGLAVFGQTYSFDGSLLVTAQTMDSTLQLATDSPTITILAPFGLPGIEFTDLYLGVHYTFATNDRPNQCSFLVGGSVAFGEALAFSGRIQLKETTPVLATIALDKDLSIGQFFARCVDAEWPSEFIDLIFEEGGQVYYYNQAVDADGQFRTGENVYVYQSGFNVDATVTLVILIEIPIKLTARVMPENEQGTAYKGIIIDAGLTAPIDLFVLQIASTRQDATGKYIDGPSLEVNTVDSPASFGLTAGFNFFQEPFGAAGVFIRKLEGYDEMELKGYLQAARECPPFGRLELRFSYSDRNGFKIDDGDWPPFDIIDNLIDFVAELERICEAADSAGICGALADLVTNVLFQTDFRITPSFKTKKVDKEDGTSESALYFVLNGSYILSLFETGELFVTVKFPPLEFFLPPPTSLSELPNLIADSIRDAATSFVRALIDDSEQIAMFLAILFAQEAADIALQMACRGLIDAATAAATSAAAEAFATAGGIAAGAAAIAAAVAAVIDALPPDTSCFVAGTKVRRFDNTLVPIEEVDIGDTLLGLNGVPNKVLKFDRPKLGNRTLFAFNDGPYFVTEEHPFLTKEGWKSLNPKAMAKENAQLIVGKLGVGDILFLANGQETELLSIRETRGDAKSRMYNFVLNGNNTYYADDFLAHNKEPEPDPDPKQPKIQSVTCENESVILRWQGAQYASGYDFLLCTSTGVTYDERSFDLHALSATVRLQAALPPGRCTAKVRSTRGSKRSAWAEAYITKLEVPSPIGMTAANNQLTVTWNPAVVPANVGEAVMYDVQLSKDGMVISSVQSRECTRVFEMSGAGTYHARVRATCGKNCITSDWNASGPSIVKLPPPPAVTLSYAKSSGLTIRWTTVANASGYAVEIMNTANGMAIVASADVPGAASDHCVVPVNDHFGRCGTYQARVKAKGTGIYIDSDRVLSPNTIEKLSMPTNVTQSYAKSSHLLSVTWDNLPISSNKVQYRIERCDELTDPLHGVSTSIPVPSGTPVTVNQVFDVATFISDQAAEYRFKVQAIGNECAIDSDLGAAPMPTRRLGKPNHVNQTYDQMTRQFKVVWDVVAHAVQYRIQIVDVGNARKVMAEKSNASSASPECIFMPADFSQPLDGIYEAHVQALGTDQMIDGSIASGPQISICSHTFPALDLKFVNGQNQGKIIATWRPAQMLVLKGLVFSGDKQYVQLQNPAHLNFGGTITIEAWVKPRDYASVVYGNIVAHGYTNQPWAEVFLRINHSTYDVGSMMPTQNPRASYPIPAEDEGAWVHLAGLYDGHYWRLYRNGQSVANSDIRPGPVTVDLGWAIGAKGDGKERFFKGQIQEVRIWKSARSAQEIKEGMYKTLLGNEPNLVGYWRLDEGVGTVAQDRTSYHQHGTIVGASWATDAQSDVVVSRDITYDLALFDAQGNQVGETIVGATLRAEFVLQNPQDGASYTVKIRERRGESVTHWSDGTRLAIKLLTTPTNVQGTITNNVATVSYGAVARATEYNVQVIDTIADMRPGWETSTMAKEWRQTFVANITGMITHIHFDRTSRPSTGSELVAATMYVYDDKGNVVAFSRFLDDSGKGRIAINGKVQQGKTYTLEMTYATEVPFFHGTQNHAPALPVLLVEGMPFQKDGKVPEIKTRDTRVTINMASLDQQRVYQVQVTALADPSRSECSAPITTR